MTVEEVIIGLLGAGILGMLGFFMTSIKSDIRDLGERMGRSETILTNVVEQLAVIATTQAVHGRVLDEHTRKLEEHGRILAEHSRTLAEHGRILEEHSRMLAQVLDYGERIAALEAASGAG